MGWYACIFLDTSRNPVLVEEADSDGSTKMLAN